VSVQAATAEHRLTGPAPTRGEPAGALTHLPPRQARLAQIGATVAIAGLLCFATFMAGGGLRLESMTTVEMAFTLGGGILAAFALLLAPRGAPAFGVWPVALLFALTALTAVSVAWSVAPDSSWQDAGRMLAYTGVFGAATALARVAPRGWSALLGGVVLSASVVCGYALLTKVLPDKLDAGDVYARLQEPYGYWNAIGLTAALGAIGCLWLGARRAGHGLVSACAYPAMSLSLVTLMLAYSRGALAALTIGVALWFAIVPLRLRAARVLLVGALGAAPVIAWDFAKHSLSSDGVALSARTTAGHQLGVLLVAMLLAEMSVGVAIGFFGARKAPSPAARRRVAGLLIASLVLAVGAGAGALAVSKRGFTGTISHAFDSLTDPNAPVPKNTPGRLTSAGSVRARYWNEALEIFKAHPALGTGALGYETARLRYRKESLDVKHAHGYVVQTLADLGIAGLLVTLALLAVWLACAARATRPANRRLAASMERRRLAGVTVPRSLRVSWRREPTPYSPERIGLLAMLCLVIVFGVHSFADWTWYVPGNACVALLCAGWIAGRGPLRATAPDQPTAVLPPPRRHLQPGAPSLLGRAWAGVRGDPRSLALAVVVLAAALLAAWTEWQPQRSVEESDNALTLLVRNPLAARTAAARAVSRDPLSAQALFTLSAVQHASGEAGRARATLQKAVRLQPSNPQTWLTLGEYDRSAKPRMAVNELRAAVYLDPRSIPIQNAYVEALRATQNLPRTAHARSTARAPGTPPAARTSTSAKPKSASRAAKVRRV
jgi:hypothetical protein